MDGLICSNESCQAGILLTRLSIQRRDGRRESTKVFRFDEHDFEQLSQSLVVLGALFIAKHFVRLLCRVPTAYSSAAGTILVRYCSTNELLLVFVLIRALKFKSYYEIITDSIRL
eukprot:scaffold51358_cov34-Prasinocladus_malaysianus.AAC.4